MSRIRGIEVKVQKYTNSYQRNGCESKKKDEGDVASSYNTKDNAEKEQIKDLLQKLPKLEKIFSVHRKIGEGTFSSVYLGSLRQHERVPAAERRWFAIKHLVPTAHPARIEHELRCLRDMGGSHNVIGVDLCLRHLDTVVFVMPYIPHRKFSEYMGEMDASELREYARALLSALRHVHSFGVIHRDVKPSNFLYDRENRRYLLVDFGLAQRMCPPPPALPKSPVPPPAHKNLPLKRTRDEDEALPDSKRFALDLTVSGRELDTSDSAGLQKSEHTKIAVPLLPPATRARAAPAVPPAVPPGPCACAGAGGVCAACSARPAPRAPRAGTQGFRPPEVLLKYPYQTTAVDMWACGVVLVSVLCARYPLLRAPDDAAALAELADLLGSAPLQRAAAALGRRLVVSAPRRGLCLRKLCARLRAGGRLSGGNGGGGAACARCGVAACVCRNESAAGGGAVAGFPESAFSLAAQLLEPDPRARISAEAALQHPFLLGQ